MLILSTTQYFLGVDIVYTKQDAVFPGRGYCVYRKVHSIFGGLILLILRTTQYFLGIYTAYTKQDAVSSGAGYCLY